MDSLKTFLTQWKDALAAVQSAVTVLGLLVGALWAYFKVFKGRIYTQRLEPCIGAKLIYGNGYLCAVVEITIKNVGLTRVDIDTELSAIEADIYTVNDYAPQFHNAMWTRLGVVSAVQHHAWVEPGEIVSEERLLALPNERPIALGLRLRVLPKASRYRGWRQLIEWNALAVAFDEGANSPMPVQDPGGDHVRTDHERGQRQLAAAEPATAAAAAAAASRSRR